MYILSIEELHDSINQIILTLEHDEASFGSIVIELAHQLRDELSQVCAE